jgi:hypothetical protein
VSETARPSVNSNQSVQYAHQHPLTTEGLARLARLFILLASVELPESSVEESRHEETDHRTSAEPS